MLGGVKMDYICDVCCKGFDMGIGEKVTVDHRTVFYKYYCFSCGKKKVKHNYKRERYIVYPYKTGGDCGQKNT